MALVLYAPLPSASSAGRLDEENMNLSKILADLRREREQIDEAILSLERLAAGSGPRRGRPPGWLKAHKRPGRPAGSKGTKGATKTAAGD